MAQKGFESKNEYEAFCIYFSTHSFEEQFFNIQKVNTINQFSNPSFCAFDNVMLFSDFPAHFASEINDVL